MKITKLAMFTDIHWGARNNSDQHNMDNLDFIDWFIQKVKEEKPSHIAFLGDWFENRNQINIQTLLRSQEGARRLNELGIPIIFIVGNHDLYHRSDRAMFSTNIFKDLENFIIIDQPARLSKDWFVAPFLFRKEYPDMVAEINASKYVLGHFEFKGYVVTGESRVMDHGPDADDFSGPRYIFSGHFHKRQFNKNIIYIGNAFPTNYGDAGDAERGMCVFDIEGDEVYFHNWEHAPLFFKTRLSRVLGGEMDFPARARVRCLLDMDVGYSEVQELREEMIENNKLREFSVEEDLAARKDMISEGLDLDDLDLSSLDNTVRHLIHEGVKPGPTIDPNILIELYEELS